MDARERGRLYYLLSKLFPNARQMKDRDTLAAWDLVLERYPYEPVRQAALDYAARKNFFPDLADLTGAVAPLAPPQEDCRVLPRLTAGERRQREQLLDWQRRWHEELERRELPTLAAALERGMSPGRWRQLLEQGGAFEENAQQQEERE